MISAESGTSFVERAYELGVSDYISRPFDALIVRRRVVNTLMLYAKQKLMPEEFEVMKNHATVGAAMLKALPAYQDEALVKVAYETCRWHHERYAIPMACGAKTFRFPPRSCPWRTSMTR